MRTVLTAVLVLLLVGVGYAQFVPVGGALPSSGECAKRISSTPDFLPELHPENRGANFTTPTVGQLAPFYAHPLNFSMGPPVSDFFTVDGNFTGTTDQLIQWAACKWGVNLDTARAQAWYESTWVQSTRGDMETDQTRCKGGNGYTNWQPEGYCWTSFGIIQVKCTSFNTCPMSQQSTAFNLDFRFAYWRACMNGHIEYYKYDTPVNGYPHYPYGTAQQMADGCLGSWYSGAWYDQSALDYIARVHGLEQIKPWLPALRITSPAPNATVSGRVSVSFVGLAGYPLCFYGCLNVDGVRVTCEPGAGPQIWDSTPGNHVPPGKHTLQITAYTCSLPSGNDQPNGWPPASITVSTVAPAAASAKKRQPHWEQD